MKKLLKFAKWPALLVGIVLMLGACHRAPSRTANSPKHMRGIWFTDVGTMALTYTTLLDESLHHISKSGYDRVYFSVYGLRGQLYSTKQRRETIPKLPLINPMASMARESRRQGLKPYAWFEYGLMLPQYDPVAKNNPDWLLTMANGEQVIENHGMPMVWLDPAHPGVQAYILGHIDDILQEQSLAGIQLDDHWAVPRQFGDRQQDLTALTAKVSERIKTKNPALELSLSPNPYQFSRNEYNQDWLSWVRQGIIDEVVVQVYRSTPAEVQQTVANSGIHTASRYVPVGIGLYTGIKAKPFNLQAIKNQIQAVEDQNLGHSLFVWEFLVLRAINARLNIL
jgi:uncharacterized lipoprotein YddW (UPF0748 family)